MEFKIKCDSLYENGTPLIEDDVYDSLFGSNEVTVSSKIERDTILPVWMGSLDKIRTKASLETWCRKFEEMSQFVVTEKLDGISALVCTTRMYTRGNGVRGCDISNFLKFLRIPRISHYVRGELIMKNSTFRDQFASEYKNARNLVAGQFSSKNIIEHIMTEIDFVAHELIEIDRPVQRPPSEQIEILKHHGFNVPIFRSVNKSFLKQELLNELMDQNRKESEYSSDGLVITFDDAYEKNTAGNPKHMISFKKEIDIASAIATVREVVWSPSSKNIWIPVVHIDPVNLSGITISRLTGHNAKFIVDSGISSGAKLICVRSGDVIPHILKVIERGFEPVKLPSDKWKGVNVITEQNDLSDVKVITNLLCKLGVKNISLKTVAKLYNKCNVKTFFDVLTLTSDNLTTVFQEKTRNKIISEILNLKSQQHKFSTLVGASGVLGYGIGEKRVEMLIKNDTTFMHVSPTLSELLKIDGFSIITGQLILQNHASMVEFVNECKKRGIRVKEDEDLVNEYNQAKETICLSGFRDPMLAEKFNISESVTKKCVALVVQDNIRTNKYKQAEKLKIQIIRRTSEEFTNMLRKKAPEDS